MGAPYGCKWTLRKIAEFQIRWICITTVLEFIWGLILLIIVRYVICPIEQTGTESTLSYKEILSENFPLIVLASKCLPATLSFVDVESNSQAKTFLIVCVISI